MRWGKSHRFDSAALPLADRHYNRRKVGSPQFVPPGRCVVLRCEQALWTTSWPYAEFVRHAWPGAWINSLFRNEGAGVASELILEAIAATRWYWPDVPALGLVTFVDASKIQSENPGYCYKRAGFHRAVCPKHATKQTACAACHGRTEAGLLAFQLFPHEMPDAQMPRGETERLIA